jgi:hypothetical protein
MLLLAGLILMTHFITKSQNEQQNSANATEYMTIIGKFSNKKIKSYTVSQNNNTESKSFYTEHRSKQKPFETSHLLNLLEAYSKEGWVVQSTNITGKFKRFRFYVLLKREKLN